MKIQLWPKDATSGMEKFVWAFASLFVPLAYLFLQLSAWGILHNAYQRSVAAAGAGWHILGFIASASAVVMFIMACKDKEPIKSQIGWIIFTAFVAIMGLLAYSGFVWFYRA